MLLLFPKNRKKLYLSILAAITMVIGGTVGYMLIEDYTFSEAFFMTIITVSTVGFGVVKPLSQAGIFFTSVIILISFGILGYVISNITGFLLDGELQATLKRQRMKKEFKKINNHIIVCGYGRNGKQATLDLLAENKDVVVIEKQPQEIDENIDKNPFFHIIFGDASLEEVLQKAKVSKAKALITTLPSDADNLFVVLTARDFNKQMTIISRASDDNSDRKLKRAGATNVIMPDRVGGSRMAKLVSQPDVIEFLENIMLKSGDTVSLVEVPCYELPPEYMNKAISELNIRRNSGANIIGVKMPDGEYVYNPPAEFVITRNTMLFVLGEPKQIKDFKKILNE